MGARVSAGARVFSAVLCVARVSSRLGSDSSGGTSLSSDLSATWGCGTASLEAGVGAGATAFGSLASNAGASALAADAGESPA